MAGKPYQSKLLPYEDEIIALRRKKPPKAYSQIAKILHKKYQLTVSRGTIFSFIKLRVKKELKPCKYDAWDIKLPEADNTPVTETKAVEKPRVSSISGKPKQPEADWTPGVSRLPEATYSETYNLTRMSDEEAAKWLKFLEERKKKEAEKTKDIEKSPIPEKPKVTEETFVPPKLSDFGWVDVTKPYKERLSPEEKAILLKRVREKERQREEERERKRMLNCR